MKPTVPSVALVTAGLMFLWYASSHIAWDTLLFGAITFGVGYAVGRHHNVTQQTNFKANSAN